MWSRSKSTATTPDSHTSSQPAAAPSTMSPPPPRIPHHCRQCCAGYVVTEVGLDGESAWWTERTFRRAGHMSCGSASNSGCASRSSPSCWKLSVADRRASRACCASFRGGGGGRSGSAWIEACFLRGDLVHAGCSGLSAPVYADEAYVGKRGQRDACRKGRGK